MGIRSCWSGSSGSRQSGTGASSPSRRTCPVWRRTPAPPRGPRSPEGEAGSPFPKEGRCRVSTVGEHRKNSRSHWRVALRSFSLPSSRAASPRPMPPRRSTWLRRSIPGTSPVSTTIACHAVDLEALLHWRVRCRRVTLPSHSSPMLPWASPPTGALQRVRQDIVLASDARKHRVLPVPPREFVEMNPTACVFAAGRQLQLFSDSARPENRTHEVASNAAGRLALSGLVSTHPKVRRRRPNCVASALSALRWCALRCEHRLRGVDTPTAVWPEGLNPSPRGPALLVGW